MDTRQPTYLSYHLSLCLSTYLPDLRLNTSPLLPSSLSLSLSSLPLPSSPLRSVPRYSLLPPVCDGVLTTSPTASACPHAGHGSGSIIATRSARLSLLVVAERTKRLSTFRTTLLGRTSPLDAWYWPTTTFIHLSQYTRDDLSFLGPNHRIPQVLSLPTYYTTYLPTYPTYLTLPHGPTLSYGRRLTCCACLLPLCELHNLPRYLTRYYYYHYSRRQSHRALTR